MIPYFPIHRSFPLKIAPVPTAWKEVVPIIESVTIDFSIPGYRMLEIGVDHGYSASVFSNFFDYVVGVDHFKGDAYTGDRIGGIYTYVLQNMLHFPNVTLVPLSYQEFFPLCQVDFDFIHIDIVHDYNPTYEAGEWAISHAPVVMFHDTLAFPEVMSAVKALATAHNLHFYHVAEQHGVGILSRREKKG